MWDWAIWGALIAASLAGIGAATLLVRRALEAWRAIKDVRARLVETLGELSAKAEATADKAEAAGGSEELRASVSRLRASLAGLAVLRAALGDARAVVPRL